MNSADAAHQRLEAYLKQLRTGLHGLPEEKIREIIAELRSHVMDRAASEGGLTIHAVNTALQALGTPEELAREYANDEVLARAEVSRTPLRLLDSLFGWATMSVGGFFVLIVTVIGYFLGGVFLMVTALKPFHPATAGLWVLRDSAGDLELSVRMGFGTAPSNGHELLGWWGVPAGLVVGCGLVILTSRFALWCVRMYRRSRLLPQRS